MEKKQIVFEGKIDGVYSQIFYLPESEQFFLMRHIKESSRNRVIKQLVELNKTRKPEDKVKIVAMLYKNKKTDFSVGRISQKKALEHIQNNRNNKVNGKSQILPVPENYNYEKQNQTSYIGNLVNNVKCASKEFLQDLKTDAGKKATAIVILTSMAIGGAALAIHNANNRSQSPEPTPPGYSTSVSSPANQNPTEPENDMYHVDLKQVDLETDVNGKLTSKSAKELTTGIVGEINELYNETGWETPKVIKSETLTSLFYAENSLKTEDSKDAYVGIGQMSKVAIKDAIIRANKLYAKALTGGSVEELDNYIIDYICSKGNESIDEQVNRLWEQSKTDAVMCGCLTGLYLADLSDRYESSLNGNEAAVIIMYNAGEGNFANYQKLGIINLSADKTGMKINLENVEKLDSPTKIAKWNEAVNYVIKVLEGSKRLKENPNSDVHEICEQTRQDVGKNDNYLKEPNMNQYKYAPEGVVFMIKEMEHESQPGQ